MSKGDADYVNIVISIIVEVKSMQYTGNTFNYRTSTET